MSEPTEVADRMPAAGTKVYAGFAHASDAEAVLVSFDAEVPAFEGPQFESEARQFYRDQASRLVLVLQEHLPGGLVDALFAVLADKKASIFRIADTERGKP